MNNKHGYSFYVTVATIAGLLALASVPYLFKFTEEVMKLSIINQIIIVSSVSVTFVIFWGLILKEINEMGN